MRSTCWCRTQCPSIRPSPRYSCTPSTLSCGQITSPVTPRWPARARARKRVSVGGIALGAYMPARDAAAAVLALSALSSSATPPGVLENPVVQLQAEAALEMGQRSEAMQVYVQQSEG